MGSQTQRRANSSSAAYLLWDVGKALHASKSQCPQLSGPLFFLSILSIKQVG